MSAGVTGASSSVSAAEAVGWWVRCMTPRPFVGGGGGRRTGIAFAGLVPVRRLFLWGGAGGAGWSAELGCVGGEVSADPAGRSASAGVGVAGEVARVAPGPARGA